MDNITKLTDEQVTTIVKKKRNRPDLANFGQEYIEPGDNAKYVAFALETYNAPKIDIQDPEQVNERINWYFQRCIEQDMKPGVVGLANALGVSRQTLWYWKNGERRDISDPVVNMVKKAYNFLEELWEDYMLNGRVSPPNGIFLGKNHFSYKDQTDVVVTPNNPMQDLDAESARKRLVEAIPDDDE